MLVLTRKRDESILISDDIEIIVIEVSEDKVKLGIKAPKTMKVFRKELLQEIAQENKNSAVSDKLDVQKLSTAINQK